MAASANVGVGYRREVNGWLLGVNTFLDADIRYSTCVAALAGSLYRQPGLFPATIISSHRLKTSAL